MQLLKVDKQRQGVREGARALKKQAEAATCALPVCIKLPGGASLELPYDVAADWLTQGAFLPWQNEISPTFV